MDLSLERDSSALGSLFQQIINDMKVGVIDLSNSFKQSHSFVECLSKRKLWKLLGKTAGKATVEFPHELYLRLSFRIGFCFAFVFQWKTREIESFVLVFCFVWNEPDTCCKWENCSICNWASCVNRLESYQVTTITVNKCKKRFFFLWWKYYIGSRVPGRAVCQELSASCWAQIHYTQLCQGQTWERFKINKHRWSAIKGYIHTHTLSHTYILCIRNLWGYRKYFSWQNNPNWFRKKKNAKKSSN